MNKIKAVSAMMLTGDKCVVYAFMRRNTRYYNAQDVSQASTSRIRRLLREHGTLYINTYDICVTWHVRD